MHDVSCHGLPLLRSHLPHGFWKLPCTPCSCLALTSPTAHARAHTAQVSSPEDKPASREVLSMRRELFHKLGWPHWERQEARRLAEAFPPAGYPLF